MNFCKNRIEVKQIQYIASIILENNQKNTKNLNY